MFDIKDLYQEIIVDHNRNPRNFGKLDGANKTLEGYNPLCGDKLVLYLKTNDNKIEDISFDGKTLDEAETLFNEFHHLITSDDEVDTEHLGKLAALAGVKDYPARVKCASLCWHTLHSAIQGDEAPVSTE